MRFFDVISIEPYYFCGHMVKYDNLDSQVEVSIMPTIKAEDCVGCGACVDACPENAITMDDIAVIGADCIECGACIDECPSGAIVE